MPTNPNTNSSLSKHIHTYNAYTHTHTRTHTHTHTHIYTHTNTYIHTYTHTHTHTHTSQVAVEGQFSGLSDNQIAPAKSAYTYFQSEQTKAVKAALEASGLDSDFGAVASAVSKKWRSTADRSRWESLAAADKVRHDDESRARDAVIAQEQEARRLERDGAVEEGSRRKAAAGSISAMEERERRRKEAEAKRKPKVLSEAEVRFWGAGGDPCWAQRRRAPHHAHTMLTPRTRPPPPTAEKGEGRGEEGEEGEGG